MSVRIIVLFLALAASGAAISQDADPPGRVARLSYVEGDVLLQAADAGAPEHAELNRPLTVSDRLLTEPGSRAELSVGTAALRLDANTDLSIANLDQDIAQIQLNSGTVGIHLRELRESESFEIDTPNATVQLLRPGDYRIEIDLQGATVLAVRSGDAQLDSANGPVRLRDGQQVRIADGEQFADVLALDPQDEFDDWCIEREQAIADAEATRYVSRDVVGYEDLDTYGNWYSEPGYGAVWAPRITMMGWAPYRFGNWGWVAPWGWTWIDRAPWGFAPFHYGRWAFLRQRWCWVPPRHHRPVWAPALVGWNGMPGVRDPSPARIGWFPLAPREVYVPGHRASPRYLRNVNISNTTIASNADITNVVHNRVKDIHFANRDTPGAVTTLPRTAFVAKRPIPRQALRAAPNETESVTHVRIMPRPTPDRASDRRVVPGVSTPASLVQTNTARPAGDGRMTVPRMPTDRRSIQGNSNWTRMQENATAFARNVQRPAAIARPPQQPALRVAPPQSNGDRSRGTPSQNGQSRESRSDAASTARTSSGSERAGFAARSGSSPTRVQVGRPRLSTDRQ